MHGVGPGRTPTLTDDPTGSPALQQLTLVIACHEMAPQLANTLASALPPYQQGIAHEDVDVVVVDNGSSSPMAPESLPESVTYEHIAPEDAAPYPGPAINEAVHKARGNVGIMIDGARMLTPGVLQGAIDVLARWPGAVVDAKGWHLGHQAQQDTLAAGGDPRMDQDMLEQVQWQQDGYRLFDISAPTFCTRDGFLSPANESTALFTSRDQFLACGGYDERFRSSGGGLANIDLWWRLTAVADPVVTLLGEGTFHQAHGGASTGLPRPELGDEFQRWREEYERLTDRDEVGPPPHDPLLVGRMGPAATRVQVDAVQEAAA